MSDEEENTGSDDAADDWAAAMAEQEEEEAKAGGTDASSVLDAEPVSMEEFAASAESSGEGAPDLDVIMDIPVKISMEVGNSEISIRNLLQLNQGSVIELDRLAGEPLDILVNGTLIAHGEVVVVNDKFGIRMTDVISPSERIKKLR